ncbi:MAG: M28 family peptidase [Gemmatimonadetes bacterium]|nr:M28 family peptidase [Gemmatimonadota bacterium]
MSRGLVACLAVLSWSACAESAANDPLDEEAIAPALASITAEDLLRRTARLADDAFEGRAPGTPGEERTVEYLTAEFQAIGLQPGHPDGRWVQDVPLVGFTAEVTTRLTSAGRPFPLTGGVDYVADTRRVAPLVEVTDADIVFVGYGVVAPEYGWDDYKDVDVAGKTILMLVNDPAIPDPADPSRLDESMFRGRAMTYYGRWTYKYEIAAQKGAAAALVIHETGPAGYPFGVVGSGWGREAFDIASADGNVNSVAVRGWIRDEAVSRLLAGSNLDFAQLKQAALSKDFRPVALDARASFAIRNTLREVQSRNLIAKLEGSDPVLKDEYVIYTAHWDHLGRDPSLEGDQIFNGALDNASGTAALLELAEAAVMLDPAPPRSMLFLAVTAEEKGLLGAKYYAQNPLYPLVKTLANINMDGVNQWGRTSDMVVIGLGNSTLDDLLEDAAAAQGRTLAPDPESEKGFFYRSDHFEFAKEGVPALYTDAGTLYVDKPAGWGQQKRDEYTANDYHQVSDEIKPDWDLTGAAEDLQLLLRVGLRVTTADVWPAWKPGTEFLAKREAMLSGAAR